MVAELEEAGQPPPPAQLPPLPPSPKPCFPDYTRPPTSHPKTKTTHTLLQAHRKTLWDQSQATHR